MVKQQGSLGFTLRKDGNSLPGHRVRALVRQPATTDGRIQPGDRIVAVNDVPMCSLSHEQAVVFLRMADDTVRLRLQRELNATTNGGANAGSTSWDADYYEDDELRGDADGGFANQTGEFEYDNIAVMLN